MDNNPEKAYKIRGLRFPEDMTAVTSLWLASAPGVHVGFSDSPDEIARKLARDPDLFLVAEVGDRLVGTVIGGYDGRRGLIYHLAVDSQYRSMGIGSALMKEVEHRLHQKGCYKAYLMVVKGNPEVENFYQNRGWSGMEVSLLAKELGSDGGCPQELC